MGGQIKSSDTWGQNVIGPFTTRGDQRIELEVLMFLREVVRAVRLALLAQMSLQSASVLTGAELSTRIKTQFLTVWLSVQVIC